jgi:glycosyltransferase involved in cell wall biosynthesis
MNPTNKSTDSERRKATEKTVLIVAYHFPPCSGSSGFLRALKFTRYLPHYGWRPSVLTVRPTAYERLDVGPLGDVPAGVPIHRAFALDTKRHFSIGGRYPRILALPDRWASWVVPAVPLALRKIKRENIQVLFTTYPIASAVLIGAIVHRLSGIRWVVDFRDAMTEDGYPADTTTHAVYRSIERCAIREASLLVFTADASRDLCARRNPELRARRSVVIPNGFDEQDFSELKVANPATGAGPFVRILHSGLLNPLERDPSALFRAVSSLKKEGRLSSQSLAIDLRAPGMEEYYRAAIRQLSIDDIVHVLPPLAYKDALREAAASDSLLLLQAQSVDHQIPAKAYEYLRLCKPILALVSPAGETGRLLSSVGSTTVIDITDEAAIRKTLPEFLRAVQSGTHPIADGQAIARFSRLELTGQLAGHLDSLVGAPPQVAED